MWAILKVTRNDDRTVTMLGTHFKHLLDDSIVPAVLVRVTRSTGEEVHVEC